MNCSCGGVLSVADSRREKNAVWRRRQCPVCKKRYHTIEVFEGTSAQRDREPAVKKTVPKVSRERKPRAREKVEVKHEAVVFSTRKRIEDLQEQRALERETSKYWS